MSKRIYYTRSLKNFKSFYNGKFEYISITNTGIYNFFRLFKACADNPIKDYKQYQKYLEKILRHISGIYSIDCWKAVQLDNKRIGFIEPHIHTGNKRLGSILNMGLKPEFRGKGYGKIIHAKSLELLKQMGAKKYIGSTELSNQAMVRIFEINGCKRIGSSKSGKALLQTL